MLPARSKGHCQATLQPERDRTHAITLPNRWLADTCPSIHRTRPRARRLAVGALLEGQSLTLSDPGRHLPRQSSRKHGIGRIDRLLGHEMTIAELARALNTPFPAGYGWLRTGRPGRGALGGQALDLRCRQQRVQRASDSNRLGTDHGLSSLSLKSCNCLSVATPIGAEGRDLLQLVVSSVRDPDRIDMSATRARLAIFLPAMLGGGAERTMLNLAHGLLDRGYDVDLVLSRSAGPLMDQVSEKVRIIDLTQGKVIRRHHTLRSLPALIRYLRTDPPDGMLASMAPANLMAVIAKRLAGYEKRLVLNEQNTLSFQASNSHRRLIRLSPRLARVLYPSAFRVTGVSEGVVDDLVRTIGIDRDKVEVVYNPGITAELRRKAREELEHPWFGDGEPPVIVAVGSLTEQKDFATLLEAFASVRAHRPARLIILGEGRLRGSLEARVEQLGLTEDVSLAGFVKNPYPYMSKAAVFVLSSCWEGLPTVLVEAMCCGAPVVATDCPSGPREILKDGALGHLVPVGDPAALGDAILRVLDGQIPVVDRECLNSYDIENVMDKYVDLLLH